jgi:uncharacterized protein YbbC (DUF1343 family)
MKIKTFIAIVLNLPALWLHGQSVTFGSDALLADAEVLQNRRYAICANKASYTASGVWIVDTLLNHSAPPSFILAPEHGLTTRLSAGETVTDSRHASVAVIGLYGRQKSPPDSLAAHIDLIIYDIQDLGLRFYTYISTLKKLAEYCSRHRLELWILDRPNPLNGITIQGPVLHDSLASFVGAYPIPIRYGLTPGELLKMAVGEGWVPPLQYRVWPVSGWRRHMSFSKWQLPWYKPSPNIPDAITAEIYSGTCLFEGTVYSEGRGTAAPFRVFGHPQGHPAELKNRDGKLLAEPHRFIPMANTGARHPKFNGLVCHGFSINYMQDINWIQQTVSWIACLYQTSGIRPFFIKGGNNYYFDLLVGNSEIRVAIEKGAPLAPFFDQWQEENKRFSHLAGSYWLYPF